MFDKFSRSGAEMMIYLRKKGRCWYGNGTGFRHSFGPTFYGRIRKLASVGLGQSASGGGPSFTLPFLSNYEEITDYLLFVS